jgi:hypothetical protein
MSQDLFSPETVTADRLFALFDAALFKVSREAGSDALQIAGDHTLWVLLDESRTRLRFLSVFAMPDELDAGARMAIANRINDKLVSVRAAVSGDRQERFCLDHYLFLEGGLSAKSIGFALKQFESQVASAVQEFRAAMAETQATRLALEKQLKSSFPESRATSDKAMLSSGRG